VHKKETLDQDVTDAIPGDPSTLVVYEERDVNGMKSYHSGEEAMSFTSFGLSKSDKDFIEVSCSGYDSVAVHSDHLHYPSHNE
jgi:hypothetical protein